MNAKSKRIRIAALVSLAALIASEGLADDQRKPAAPARSGDKQTSSVADCLTQGKAFWDRELPGRALLLAAAALESDSSNQDAAALAEKCCAELAKQCGCRLTLEVTDARQDERNVTTIRTTLLSELQARAPKNLTFETSDDVLRILSKIAKTKDQAPFDAFEPAKYAASIRIADFQVEKPPPDIQNLAKNYQSGTRKYPNPAYISKQIELASLMGQADRANELALEYQKAQTQQQQAFQDNQLQRRALEQQTGGGLQGAKQRFNLSTDSTLDAMGKAGSGVGGSISQVGAALSAMGAAQRAGELENQLRNTPQLLEEKVYETWRYQIETHRKVARVSFGCVVTRISDQQSLLTLPVDKTATATDTTTQNPNPSIGIAADPLELPSDVELRDRVLKPAISLAATSILLGVQKDFASHFLKEGARLQEAGDMDGAMEMLVKFMLCVPASPANTKETETVTAWLNKCSGLPSLPQGFPEEFSFTGLDGGATVMGAKIQSVTAETAKSLGFSGPNGLIITTVEKGSPAEKVGLRWGDIITEADSKRVNDLASLVKTVGRGGKHALSVFRSGQLMKVEIQGTERGRRHLAARQVSETAASAQATATTSPTAPPAQTKDISKPASRFAELLGVSLQDVTVDVSNLFRIEPSIGVVVAQLRGVVVAQLRAGSLAQTAGVRWGDVITAIDGVAVRSLADLDGRVLPSRDSQMSLTLRRGGQELIVCVRISN